MQRGQLFDTSGARLLLANVRRTLTPWDRLRGLLGRAPLGPNSGLLIDPCHSIHTCFMRYAIDVVYLDRDWSVTRIVPAVPPWRFSYAGRACMTLELASGRAAELELGVGQVLSWRPLAK